MGHKLIVLPSGERLVVLGAVLLIFLISRALQFYLASRSTHNEPGGQRDYGMAGGAICPKCGQIIRLGLFSIKLGLGARLARCETCGKWSIVQRASLEALRAAETAEASPAQPAVTGKSEAEKLEDMLDQSRYTDK